MGRGVPVRRELDVGILGGTGVFHFVVEEGVVRVGRGAGGAGLENVVAFEAEEDCVGGVGGGDLLFGLLGWHGVFGCGGLLFGLCG